MRNAISAQQRPRWHGPKRLVASGICVAGLWLVGCAGTPRSETVPRCPVPSEAAVAGFERVLDLQEAGDRELDPFVVYVEELLHYCRRVLPAWIGE